MTVCALYVNVNHGKSYLEIPLEFAQTFVCVCMFGGYAWVMQESETPASLVIDFSVPQSWLYHTKLRDKCPVPAAIAFSHREHRVIPIQR